jgi:Flp pilus assembly pilin Flp
MTADGIVCVGRSAWTAARLLARDDRGQDLIEYALLTAGLGIAGAATWPLIVTSIGTAYRTLDINTQNLWEPPPPGSSGP